MPLLSRGRGALFLGFSNLGSRCLTNP
ncbi:uncharacterized protein G2W53_041171 [Senna tora]|uniref:Uncharacterized protein n=1 Tax=Senna tora TaxID=362788 RepID=A0A834SDB5_9FABA|nr:uncharacterized protein G2W53_041171 [Senna tora]